MRLVCHLGVHCTEGNRIQKTLLRNRKSRIPDGVLVPDPRHYSQQLNNLPLVAESGLSFSELLGEKTAAELEELQPDSLVLTSERFFGLLRNSLKRGVFYSGAEERTSRLVRHFPNCEVSVVLVIRNPATFIPALLNRSKQNDIFELTDGADPRDYRWSELIERLSRAIPDANFLICCFEDLPFLWGELIRELISVPLDQKIVGAFDLFSEFMPKEGIRRFRRYLASKSTMNELQKRRVMAAFLDKYAIEEKLLEPISIEGWGESLMGTLSDAYEDDVDLLREIPNVTLLSM